MICYHSITVLLLTCSVTRYIMDEIWTNTSLHCVRPRLAFCTKTTFCVPVLIPCLIKFIFKLILLNNGFKLFYWGVLISSLFWSHIICNRNNDKMFVLRLHEACSMCKPIDQCTNEARIYAYLTHDPTSTKLMWMVKLLNSVSCDIENYEDLYRRVRLSRHRQIT